MKSHRDASTPGERIAKMMARAGVSSRREAEAWIAQGRVAVNGKVITSPALNVTASDRITLDGEPLPTQGAHAAVSLSQAGRVGDDARRSGGTSDPVCGACRPACRAS